MFSATHTRLLAVAVLLAIAAAPALAVDLMTRIEFTNKDLDGYAPGETVEFKISVKTNAGATSGITGLNFDIRAETIAPDSSLYAEDLSPITLAGSFANPANFPFTSTGIQPTGQKNIEDISAFMFPPFSASPIAADGAWHDFATGSYTVQTPGLHTLTLTTTKSAGVFSSNYLPSIGSLTSSAFDTVNGQTTQQAAEVSDSVTVTPEPASLGLLAAGGLLTLIRRRR